jgi:hypothetical protein
MEDVKNNGGFNKTDQHLKKRSISHQPPPPPPPPQFMKFLITYEESKNFQPYIIGNWLWCYSEEGLLETFFDVKYGELDACGH